MAMVVTVTVVTVATGILEATVMAVTVAIGVATQPIGMVTDIGTVDIGTVVIGMFGAIGGMDAGGATASAHAGAWCPAAGFGSAIEGSSEPG
jgi:hypothetical protein